jgi:hypothetical protein
MKPYCFLYSNALERLRQNKMVGAFGRRGQDIFLEV